MELKVYLCRKFICRHGVKLIGRWKTRVVTLCSGSHYICIGSRQLCCFDSGADSKMSEIWYKYFSYKSSLSSDTQHYTAMIEQRPLTACKSPGATRDTTRSPTAYSHPTLDPTTASSHPRLPTVSPTSSAHLTQASSQTEHLTLMVTHSAFSCSSLPR